MLFLIFRETVETRSVQSTQFHLILFILKMFLLGWTWFFILHWLRAFNSNIMLNNKLKTSIIIFKYGIGLLVNLFLRIFSVYVRGAFRVRCWFVGVRPEWSLLFGTLFILWARFLGHLFIFEEFFEKFKLRYHK